MLWMRLAQEMNASAALSTSNEIILPDYCSQAGNNKKMINKNA